VSLAEHIITEYQLRVRELKLIPGLGGVFEVGVNGDTVFSRRKVDRFPNDADVRDIDAAIDERLKA
jgi:selT/selW/selH-like putative selenoprotein